MVGGIAKTITIDARSFGGGGPVTINLGGAVTSLTYTGNSKAIVSSEPKGWKVTGCKVPIDATRQDLEFLQGVASATSFVACSVEFQDTTAYTGTGKITGEVSYNSEAGVAEFDMEGEGEMEQI